MYILLSGYAENAAHDFTQNLVYIREIRESFIVDMQTHYVTASFDYLNINSVSDYLKWAERKIAEEEKRAKRYMPEETHAYVREVCDETLITRQMETLHTEFKEYLKEQRKEEWSGLGSVS